MHSCSNSDKKDLQLFTNLHQRYDLNSISSFSRVSRSLPVYHGRWNYARSYLHWMQRKTFTVCSTWLALFYREIVSISSLLLFWKGGWRGGGGGREGGGIHSNKKRLETFDFNQGYWSPIQGFGRQPDRGAPTWSLRKQHRVGRLVSRQYICLRWY